MQIVFVDDSKTDTIRKPLGDLHALGAVFIPDRQLKPYEDALTAIRSQVGLPPDTELKWNAPKGSPLNGLDLARRTQLRQLMLQSAIYGGIRSAVVLWGTWHCPKDPPGILIELRKYLYERIEMGLNAVPEIGAVIADKPGGGKAEEGKWLSSSLSLTTFGTDYVRPDRVVMPMLTADSHHVPHLQLADLVTAATTAAIAGREPGLALVPLLSQMFLRNRRGYIGGAGMVLWPPELNNLYHWVWGDTEYVNESKGIRVKLPARGTGPQHPEYHQPNEWSFIENDGMPGAAAA